MRSTRSVPLAVASDSSLRRIVKRNLSAILGLALLSLAAAVAASLATWTVDDPSLSHATDHPARNVLGVAGALVADLFMQFLGLATILLLLPPVTWAWRLVFGKRSGFGWKALLSWIGAILLGALALALLPVFGTWPLPTGLGGVTGDLLLKVPAFVLGREPKGLTGALLCLILVLLALALILHACRLSLRRLTPSLEGRSARPPSAPRRASRSAPRRSISRPTKNSMTILPWRPKSIARGRAAWNLALGALAHWTLSGAAPAAPPDRPSYRRAAGEHPPALRPRLCSRPRPRPIAAPSRARIGGGGPRAPPGTGWGTFSRPTPARPAKPGRLRPGPDAESGRRPPPPPEGGPPF